jgi:hypothetical protein
MVNAQGMGNPALILLRRDDPHLVCQLAGHGLQDLQPGASMPSSLVIRILSIRGLDMFLSSAV